MDKLKIPAWLLAVFVFVFIGILLEQLYISKRPVDLLGIKLNQRQVDSIGIPKGLIAISDEPCNELEGNWVNYESIAGRFAIGVGATKDDTGKTAKFSLHQTEGEFFHKLTIPEMPAHAHVQVWGQGEGNLSSAASGSNVASYRGQEIQVTMPKGGDVPHNNMPPYLALHFCIQG